MYRGTAEMNVPGGTGEVDQQAASTSAASEGDSFEEILALEYYNASIDKFVVNIALFHDYIHFCILHFSFVTTCLLGGANVLFLTVVSGNPVVQSAADQRCVCGETLCCVFFSWPKKSLRLTMNY